jgi:hypothetical protein
MISGFKKKIIPGLGNFSLFPGKKFGKKLLRGKKSHQNLRLG